jgi:hypothetical protein
MWSPHNSTLWCHQTLWSIVWLGASHSKVTPVIRVEISSPAVSVVVPTAVASRILFATATEFLTTAELVAQAPVAGNGRQVPGMTIPGAVCTALAAELFLKSALVALKCRAPDQLQTHDLAKLVGFLPQQHQVSLSAHAGADEVSFATHLDHIKDAFKEWRYLHENPSPLLNSGFLTSFAGAAKSLAAQALRQR